MRPFQIIKEEKMNCDCDTKEDEYGSEFREAMKVSMKFPWTKRPFYGTKAETHASHRPGTNRRSRGFKALSKRIWWAIKRFWWHTSDAIGLMAWLVAALMVSVMAWMCFVGVESWFR